MNRETLKDWLDIIQSVAIIVGVVIALYQLILQNDTLRATKEIESGKFILELSNKLEADKYTELINAIEDNDENFHIIKSRGGKFADNTLLDYIGNFETIGDLEKRNLLDYEMVSNEFSYEIEKAWCNKDVRSYIDETRKGDSTFYISFERLARSFLKDDKREDCSGLS